MNQWATVFLEMPKKVSSNELATDSRGEVAPDSYGEVPRGKLSSLPKRWRVQGYGLVPRAEDGEKPSGWANFVTAFEKVCQNKGWDQMTEETLVELVTSMLSGKARKAWEEWYQEEPEVMSYYLKLKNAFIGRFEEEINPWKKLVDFQNLQMGGSERIDDFAKKYLQLATTVDAEGCAVVKYYFALLSKIRELINRSTGEWPRTLKKKVALSKEVVLRDESVNFGIGSRYARNSERGEGTRHRDRSNVVCFGCHQKGHIVFRCPNKKPAGTETDASKSNSIKTLNSKKSSKMSFFHPRRPKDQESPLCYHLW